MTDDLSPAQQLRITLTAEIPHEEGQEYTAVEMLLAVANGLKLRGAVPSMHGEGFDVDDKAARSPVAAAPAQVVHERAAPGR